jgi:hypothetical protein
MAYLNTQQIGQFHEQGYLIVEDIFDPKEDLDPVIEEYKHVLDNLARELFERGEVSSIYADLPFSERLIKLYAESGKIHAQYFDFSLPQADVRADTPMWVGTAVFRMLRNEKLLDAVESLIGPEIYSNPVQHVRLKPPEHLAPKDDKGRASLGKTPVHQDNGVVLPEADQTNILTVWFPLWDANVENGCLCVWPGSHRQGLLDHCPTDLGLRIPGKVLNQSKGKAVPAPLKRGGALFMHKLTVHASYANHSNAVRWSFDLRYNPIGQPTGRSAFPGFVARSRTHPESELHDPSAWAQLWYDARRKLASEGTSAFNRWNANSPVCA